MLVVDEWERQPFGRPWLTLAIDVASRFVTGFQVSLDRPSSLTVAPALTHAVLPKEGWLSDRQLELSWPAAGLPEALHLDNAAEFKAEALERGTREYGVRLAALDRVLGNAAALVEARRAGAGVGDGPVGGSGFGMRRSSTRCQTKVGWGSEAGGFRASCK